MADGKQRVDPQVGSQRFTKSPEGFLVRRLAGIGQSRQAFATQPIGRLKLARLVAELLKVRADDGLEHPRRTAGGPSA